MNYKVLIVEDDLHIGQIVCEYLKNSGFIPTHIIDGAEAEKYINSNDDISLFILDIMVPNISGLELINIIRKNDHYRRTPIIMLTALDDESTQLTSFSSLADDYVTKPFSPKVLMKRVEALFRITEKKQELYSAHNVNLNCESYEVYDGDEKLDLTFREFELLKALMSKPNIVFSREQLLNLAWSYDYYGDDRIVDVHIKNIRKKLKNNIIETVKGVGYKISP